MITLSLKCISSVIKNTTERVKMDKEATSLQNLASRFGKKELASVVMNFVGLISSTLYFNSTDNMYIV